MFQYLIMKILPGIIFPENWDGTTDKEQPFFEISWKNWMLFLTKINLEVDIEM